MPVGRKTGGRKAGVPNKATAAKVEAIAESGLNPLDYMLSVMRDECNEQHARLDAACKAAPYVHPRLASVEHSGPGGEPIKVEYSPLEVARRLAFVLAAGAQQQQGK